MIELLKIHALVRAARVLTFLGGAAAKRRRANAPPRSRAGRMCSVPQKIALKGL
jgi:hypothetical protein